MTAIRRVALVGPNFFSYIQAIRGKLADRGFVSEFFDERHANSIRVKVLYRIGYYATVEARKNRHLKEVAAKIIDGGFTDVLLIDVEVCDAPFVARLREAGIRVHLYMWDSARNKPRYLSYLHLLHGKSSFDPEDCANHGLAYIPLFAEDVFSAKSQGRQPSAARAVDVCFCGTLHSNRAQRVGELLDFARPRGLRVELQLYFHSRWLLAVKSVFQVSNARFFTRTATRPFTKQQIFELFARSRFVFDLPHPGQRGLTARTFEALRSGTRLITFNQAARELLPASLSDRVVVVSDVRDLERLDFRKPGIDRAVADEDDYFLSLDRFVDQILKLMAD